MSELPQGWAQTILGDIVSPRGAKALPVELGDARFIGMDHIEAHTSRLLDTQPVSGFKSAVSVFKKGDILYGRLRPYLNKVYEADFDGAASAEFIVLPESPAVERRFLALSLRDPKFVAFASQRSTGDRPRVKFESVSDYPISLPPLPEQHRIVAKLDSLFERTRRAREELSHIPRLIENYKKAILEAAFRGDLTKDWRRTDELVQWKKLSLSELLAEPLSNGRSVPDGNGFPVLRLTALRNQILDLSERKLGNWDRSQAARYVVKSGDFFVSRGNGSLDLVARGSYITAVDEDVAFPDTMIRIRPDLAEIRTPFLYHQWSYVGVRSQIVAMAKTTAGIYKVSQSDLNKVQLVVPPLEEQEEIVRRIEKALHWLNIVEMEQGQATHLLDRLDQANLAKAFRGELVPQDPNDEPAAVLLERIPADADGAARAAAVPRRKNRRNSYDCLGNR